MKKILNLVIVAVAVATMVMSGCAGSSTMVKVAGVNPDKVTIWDEGKGKVTFKPKNTEIGKGLQGSLVIAKRAFQAASVYGLQNGYPYMAVVNNGISNLSGFPFNDWKSIERYTMLSTRIRKNSHFKVRTAGSEGKHFLIKTGVRLEVVFMKSKVPGLFLWDLQKLRRDTL